MALSDLSVFSEFVYSAQTEVLRQQVELFNSASQGTIRLQAASHLGDYSDSIYWAKISGLVRRRNAYGSGAVAAKKLAQLIDTMVKVAAGTPPIEINPGQFKWIQQNPEVAGATIGQQLAIDTMADMLNTGLLACSAALLNVAAVFNDLSAGTLAIAGFNTTQAKFGDRYQDILVWVMHSKPLFDVYAAAITNTTILFNFGTINIRSDPFGRIFVVSDSPGLVESGPTRYRMLGLTSNAIQVDQNDEFTDNIATLNGDENILRTYQAEWTYNLGLKGFQWDKTNGGHSPNDAAMAVGTNWDKIATDVKDLAGVVAKVQ